MDTRQSVGWTCPKCDCAYAPWVVECQRCNTPALFPARTTSIAVCTCAHQPNGTSGPNPTCPLHGYTINYTTYGVAGCSCNPHYLNTYCSEHGYTCGSGYTSPTTT